MLDDRESYNNGGVNVVSLTQLRVTRTPLQYSRMASHQHLVCAAEEETLLAYFGGTEVELRRGQLAALRIVIISCTPRSIISGRTNVVFRLTHRFISNSCSAEAKN